MKRGAGCKKRARRAVLAGAVAAMGVAPAYGQIPALWTAANGSWTTPSNWSGFVVPNGNYSVTLPEIFFPYTVRLSTDITIADMTINNGAEFLPFAGTLTAPGVITINSGGLLNHGNDATIKNATIRSAGGHLIYGGSESWVPTLDNVKLDADITLPSQKGLQIRNGLELMNRQIALTQASTFSQGGLVFAGGQTVSGTGEILVGTVAPNFVQTSIGTVTFGPGITIRAGVAGGTIGIRTGPAESAFWVNQGTIAAGALTGFNFTGTWSSPGALVLNGGRFNLGGSFTTSSLANLQRTDGQIFINGVLNNTGTTLALNATTGPMTLSPVWAGDLSTIRGGTISTSVPGLLTGSGTLDGVRVEGNVLSRDLKVLNGLHLNGSIQIGSSTSTINGPNSLRFGGSQAVTGNGEILFDDPTYYGYILTNNGTAMTLTLGSGITVRNASGSGGIELDFGSTLINEASIIAANGKTLRIGPNRNMSWVNLGRLESRDNSLLELGGSFTTGGMGSLSATNGGSVLIAGGTMNNSGANFLFDLPDRLMGLGKGGAIAGGSISASGSAALQVSSDSASPARLSDVTLNARMHLRPQAHVVATNLTLNNATIEFFSDSGGSQRLQFQGTQTLGGTGSIIFDGSFFNNVEPLSGGSLTIGPGITVLGANGGTGRIVARNMGRIVSTGAPTSGGITFQGVNDGSMHADGGSVAMQFFTNNGSITAINGSRLGLAIGSNFGSIAVADSRLLVTEPLGSIGSISVTNGSIVLGSNSTIDSTTFTTAQVTPIQRVNSLIFIGAATRLNNAGDDLVLSAALGGVDLREGTIIGGTITSLDGTKLLSTNEPSVSQMGTLDGVTLRAPFEVLAGTVRVINDWVNEGTFITSAGTLQLEGAFTPAEIGAVVRNGGALRLSGDVQNTGNAFNLNTTGSILLGNGTISGGSLTGSAPPELLQIVDTGTLNDVDLATDVRVRAGGRLRVIGGLGLVSGAKLYSGGTTSTTTSSSIEFQGTQSLTGSGEIVLDSFRTNNVAVQNWVGAVSGSLTLGSGILLQTGLGSGTVSGGSGTAGIVNQGIISSRTATKRITIVGNFENQGVVEATNGGSLTLPATFANFSAGSLNGGHWAVYGGSTMTMGTSTITTNNANVLLDGPGSTFAPINPIYTNLGSFAIDHGRNFTTVGSLTNSGFLGIGTNSTLYVAGPLNNTGSIDLVGTLIVDYDPGGFSAIFDELAGQIGTEIFSSQLDPAKGIGSADNIELAYTSFGGQPVDLTSVLMRVTYLGDANLDGIADLEDYDMFLEGYGPAEGSPFWTSGDFDYSGVVDLADFEAYLNGYYALGQPTEAITDAVNDAPLSESDKQSMLTLIATVPEPGFAGLLGLLVPLALRRSRRAK